MSYEYQCELGRHHRGNQVLPLQLGGNRTALGIYRENYLLNRNAAYIEEYNHRLISAVSLKKLKTDL